ncbi:hypothetical protein P7C70_g5625, partial [Phenoliferia sp. Uapishka_3]
MSTKKSLDFPNEVWIEILSDGELSYFDLKRVRGVSKKFKAFCQIEIRLPTFDEILFRGNPQAKLAQGSNVKLHPILHEGMSFIGEKYQDFIAVDWENDTDKEWKIAKLASAKEFATYPPLQTIVLAKHSREESTAVGGGGTVKKASGITVKDLIVGIAAAWRKKATFGGWHDEAPQKMSYCEALCECDHSAWSGWETPKISKEGQLVLRPSHYDS